MVNCEIFLIKAFTPKLTLIEDAGRKTLISSKVIRNNFVGEELAKIISEQTSLSFHQFFRKEKHP